MDWGEFNPTYAFYNNSRTSKDNEDPSWSTSFKTRRTQKTSSTLEVLWKTLFVLLLYLIETLYLEEIVVQRKDQKLYKFREGDFPRLNLRDIEDMLLLLVQNKIANLEKDVIFNMNVALRMFTRRVVILKRVEDLQLGVKNYQKKLNITRPETFRSDISKRTPYTAYSNPQRIINVDKFKRNKLMCSDELYKFSDGTLTSVRSVLHDIASNLRMDYLPKRR
nr:hypothetical protein [Tanacetum cinerariifolium]